MLAALGKDLLPSFYLAPPLLLDNIYIHYSQPTDQLPVQLSQWFEQTCNRVTEAAEWPLVSREFSRITSIEAFCCINKFVQAAHLYRMWIICEGHMGGRSIGNI
jgi:hypothetical protein